NESRDPRNNANTSVFVIHGGLRQSRPEPREPAPFRRPPENDGSVGDQGPPARAESERPVDLRRGESQPLQGHDAGCAPNEGRKESHIPWSVAEAAGGDPGGVRARGVRAHSRQRAEGDMGGYGDDSGRVGRNTDRDKDIGWARRQQRPSRYHGKHSGELYRPGGGAEARADHD